MIINKEIHERFDLLLDTLKLTQGKMSLKMGFSNGNGLSMIMRGKNELNERHLIILENTFNVNRNWLINGKGEMLNINQPINNSTINSKLSYEMTEELIKKMLEIISKQQDDIHLANQTMMLASQNLLQAQSNQAALINKVTESNSTETGGSYEMGERGRKAAGDY